MQCPNCSYGITSTFHETVIEARNLGKNLEHKCRLYYAACPECEKYMIYMKFIPVSDKVSRYNYIRNVNPEEEGAVRLIPRSKAHKPLSNDIPQDYKDDFEEAYATLDISPKASATLSRRCLQRLLRDQARVRHNDLSKEIQEVLDSNKLPSHLSNAIDSIRNIGNFGAHPEKDKSTGMIVNVEQGKAEWNIDVLEGLFDFYFIQPAETQRKKNALNQKLRSLGKPQMK